MVFLFLIVIFLGLGIFVDIYTNKSFWGITSIEHLDSLCLALIQIEATMTAVLIAVIALLSSYSTKSYLGVSLSSYVLDLEPKIFKFQTVLVFELLLFFSVVLGQIFQFYNLIISSCAISILIIIAITKRVYGVFVNANKIYGKIRANFKVIIRDKNFDPHDFITDWKKAVFDGHSHEHLDLYFEKFKELVEYLSGNSYQIRNIERKIRARCEDIAFFLLKSNEEAIRKIGVTYVVESLEFVETLKEYNLNFECLYSHEILSLWWENIKSFDADYIENLDFYYYFSLFYENILFNEKNCAGTKESKFNLYINNCKRKTNYYSRKLEDKYSFLDDLYTMASEFGEILNRKIKDGYYINFQFWNNLVFPPSYCNYAKGNNLNRALKVRDKDCDDVQSRLDLRGFFLNDNTYNELKNLKSDDNFLAFIALLNYYSFKGFLLSGNIDILKNSLFTERSPFQNSCTYENINEEFNDHLEFEFLLIVSFILYLINSNANLNSDKENIVKICNCFGNSDSASNEELRSYIYKFLKMASCDYEFIVNLDSYFRKACFVHGLNNTNRDDFNFNDFSFRCFVESFFIYMLFLAEKNGTLNDIYISEIIDTKKHLDFINSVLGHKRQAHSDNRDNSNKIVLENFSDLKIIGNYIMDIHKYFVSDENDCEDLLSFLKFFVVCLNGSVSAHIDQELPKEYPHIVLRSADDITPEILYRMQTGRLASLTIDYEFKEPLFLSCKHITRAKAKQNSSDGDNADIARKARFKYYCYDNPFIRVWKSYKFKKLKNKNPKYKFTFPTIFTDKVKTLAHAFRGFSDLESINISITSSITDLSGMFEEATSFNQPVDNWDVSNVTNMKGMFRGASSFNHSLDSWDVSNVTDMSFMFSTATVFDQSLNKWNVSKVENMCGMFKGATNFNQPLNEWIVSDVKNMSRLFECAGSFNQPLDMWNVSNVTDMSRMFEEAKSFNQPLDKWNVANVTDMNRMFYEASAFNQHLDTWNVSKVTNMRCMFNEATSFNRPLNRWNVSCVTDMSYMFSRATSFNQPLDNWNVSNVTDMSCMFSRATSFKQHLDNWSVSSNTVTDGMFSKTSLRHRIILMIGTKKKRWLSKKSKTQ